jgi:hypothetical protein
MVRRFDDQEDPTDDLEGPTEDTDEHPVPRAGRKLTLPKPDDFEEPVLAPTPIGGRPAKKQTPPAQKRIPVFRVEPERSGSRLILGIVAMLIAAVSIAFFAAPDGDTAAEIARNQLSQNPSPSQKTGTFGEWFSFGSSNDAPAELIIESPPPPNGKARVSKPAPKRRRHARMAKRARPAPAEDERYGFERTEQPKRHYDNFDASKEQGNGIPMLMVFTKPPGMAVDVDGTLAGITPMIRPLPKDTKRVKVRLHAAGFREWEQTVSPNEMDQFKVGVTMERIAE